jgi:hypothetical protein
MLGEKHTATLDALHLLSCACLKLSKDSEAEDLFRKILKIRKETLGEYHADTKLSQYWLNVTLHKRAHGNMSAPQHQTLHQSFSGLSMGWYPISR